MPEPTPPQLAMTGDTGLTVKLTRDKDPDWPVLLQVDDIVVALDREDTAKVCAWFAGLPVTDDAGLGGNEVPC